MPFQIVNQDLMLEVKGQLPPRAEWECRQNDFGGLEIMGWGGECLITVILVGMQDGRVTGAIVKSEVDNRVEVFTFDSKNEPLEAPRGIASMKEQSLRAMNWANSTLQGLMADPLAVESV